MSRKLFHTFVHETKASKLAHEHVTLQTTKRLGLGHLHILSREPTRSVGRKWDRVGSCHKINGKLHCRFTENSEATRMIATKMWRMGATVRFTSGSFSPHAIEFLRINVLESDGIVTNPESIQGRIRDRNPGSPTDKRCKVQKRFGGIGKADTTQMRAMVAALAARDAQRKSNTRNEKVACRLRGAFNR